MEPRPASALRAETNDFVSPVTSVSATPLGGPVTRVRHVDIPDDRPEGPAGEGRAR